MASGWRSGRRRGGPRPPAGLDRPPPDRARRLRHRDTGGVMFDVVAVVAALVVVALGLANLYAVDGLALAERQAVVGLVGVLVLLVTWSSRLGGLSTPAWLTYGVAVILLAVVHVAGRTVNGATRWISFGGLTFQPSELAKLGLMLVLAVVLGSRRPAWQRFVGAVATASVVIAFTVLEPDLSTATLLVAVATAMLLIGRVPGRFLLPLGALLAVAAPLVIGMLRPYQVERLGSFLVGSEQSASGAGWAVQQAHIAIGWGALFGRSSHPLTTLIAEYLPEKETDLALASLVEQYGLVAGGLAVAAVVVLVWRLAVASRGPGAPQAALLAGGLAVLIGVEVVVSVGGNLGLLPLAGVPFPLLSYGGTSLLVHLCALGVALGARRDGARRLLWAMPRWRSRRPRLVRATALGLSAVLMSFGLYGWDLQTARGDQLQAAGRSQMTRCLRLPAGRGAITDRHGARLAVDASTRGDAGVQVLAVPAMVRSDRDAVARLAALVHRPAAIVQAALDAVPATTLAFTVAEVPAAIGASVRAAAIGGVLVVPARRRAYPTGALLGPVRGWGGVATPAETRRWPGLPPGAFVGRAGIEQQYDAVLRGVDGQQCVYVSPRGVPVALGERVEPIPGANLRLSLDLRLQRQLTASLAAAMRGRANRRDIGAAVAMDVRTGHVLAMASLPSFDNNLYGPPVDVARLRALGNLPGSPTLEHVTQAAVPPGSTFKLVVASAGVAHPVIPPRRVIPTGASYTLAGHTFNNWKAMGPMDLSDSIAWSNDVYFYKLAHALGPDPIIEAARALGVGARTGIDLPAESPGYLGTPQSVKAHGGHWYGGSTVILGIGQGYLQVTPLQDALWTAAVATGHVVTPRLGLATGTDGGVYTPLTGPAPRALPFAHRLGPVREGMRRAVTGGTAGQLARLPFASAGKTGTAQDGSLAADDYDHWLSAVAPWPDPEVEVTAVVQSPGAGNPAQDVVAAGLRYAMEYRAELLSDRTTAR